MITGHLIKPRLILTVDVEEDRKDEPGSVTIHNLDCLGSFHELCMRFRVRPTYLCTYEAIRSDAFARFLDRYGADGYEVGIHLHPWSNPPLVEIDRSGAHPYPYEYPLNIFREKLEVLVQTAKERGIVPRAYRAGRYGFSPDHIPILKELGLDVDCSVTPFVSWKRSLGYMSGGPDYRGFAPWPFLWDSKDVKVKEGWGGGILEVPITILPIPRRVGGNYRLMVWLNSIKRLLPAPVANRLCPHIAWLRPLPQVPYEVLQGVIDCGIRYRLPALVMFLHSNELCEDCNPYFPSRQEVEHLQNVLEKAFSYAQELDITSVTISDFAKFFGDSGIRKDEKAQSLSDRQ